MKKESMTMSKKCIQCGAELEDEAMFCDECGAKQIVEPPKAPKEDKPKPCLLYTSDAAALLTII